ncbi:MAG TPA: glycoside hydrolase family 13 protein [Bacteroidales bacterium]|nr:glycoside hydrolase family 13 protein [Bacteroidales bacterium]
MKKSAVTLLLLFSILMLRAQQLKVDPAFWWSGMQEPELQIMLYGENIGNYTPTISSNDVVIKESVRLSNANYQIIYLDISQSKPQQFDILFTNGDNQITYQYELRERDDKRKNIDTFNSSDVLYLIMPDRFANGNPANDNIKMNMPYKVDRSEPNERHGGDLEGISNNLDYLTDLGVTSIWLNPVLENDMEGGSYHGYATTDYYKVDPRFGTNEEYAQLVEDANEKGLKVVMDIIFNHCGSDHHWMTDMPSSDWFNNIDEYVETSHIKEVYFDNYASEYDTKKLTDGWFVPTMPDLNQRNRHVAKYLIQNSIWWIEYTGINGIRQDTYPYADYDMMVDWCEAVDREYPGYNIVGEAWLNNIIGTAFWQQDSKVNNVGNTKLKTVMDFKLMGLSHSAFSEETGSWNGGLHSIYESLSYDYIYPDIYHVLRFLDNHDTDRFLKEMPTDLLTYKQAISFLLTIPGIPQLYYGTELLMHGNKSKYDGDIRLDVPGGWAEDKENHFTREGRSDLQNEAFDFLQKLLKWRKGNDIIANGKMKHYVVNNGVYLYERYLNNKKVVVVMNGTTSDVELKLDRYAETLGNSKGGFDIVSNKNIELSNTLKLTPRQTIILELN